GRELQRDFGQPPQIVATVPLLEGLDGVEKMSKSKGNYVGINEPAETMFKKLMSISDEVMFRYYELLTDLTLAEIRQMKEGHPMDLKMDLARRVITDFHGAAAAARAAEEFDRVVRHKEEPADIETVPVPEDAVVAADRVKDGVPTLGSGSGRVYVHVDKLI